MMLLINVGDFSIKFKLFNGEKSVKSGIIDKISVDGVLNHTKAWEKIYQTISPESQDIKIVGHKMSNINLKGIAIKLDDAVIKELSVGNDFHNHDSLLVANLAYTVLNGAEHYAISDSFLYNNLVRSNNFFPFSKEYLDSNGFIKIGIHSLSHVHALKKAQEELGMIRTQRTISLHLGNNCSAVAFREGVPVDFTGGVSRYGGLMSMVSPGDLDPGILIKAGLDNEKVKEFFANSGLGAVSGLGTDMRDLLYIAGYKVEDEKYVPSSDLPKGEENIERARLAIELFIDRVVKQIGAFIPILGGLDCIIFTGGIGANSGEIRSLIINKFDYLKDYEQIAIASDEESEMRAIVESHHNANIPVVS